MLPCRLCRRALPSGLCLLACTDAGPVVIWQLTQAGAQVPSAATHFLSEHTLKLGIPSNFCRAVVRSCLLQGLP